MSTSDYDYGETVDRLLEEADELTADAGDPDEALGDDLQSLAAEARELIEGAEPEELLDAVGLDVQEESGPAGLAQALADADADPLVRLRRLQLLASIAQDGDGNGDDRETLGEFEALGETPDEVGEEDADLIEGDYVDLEDLDLFGDDSGEESADEGGDEEATGGETDEDDGLVEGAIDAAEDALGDDEDDEGDEAGEEDGGAAKQVHDALSDMVDQVQEKAPDDSTRDTSTEDEDDGDEDDGDEDDGDEDDGDEDDDGSSGSATGPPSDRADMRVPPRHSTMPDSS